jgi:hypothetical protein
MVTYTKEVLAPAIAPDSFEIDVSSKRRIGNLLAGRE